MTKFIRLVQNYLLFSLPLVITCMVWSSFRVPPTNPAAWVDVLWEVLSWNLMIWFATLALFLVGLVIVPAAREISITRLANIRERDEREEYITGKAARTALLSTLSLVAFLLFFSIFSVSLTRVPPDQTPDGKSKSLSVGANFGFFDDGSASKSSDEQVLFRYDSLPISKTAILLLVLIWQLATFHLIARRETQGHSL